MQPNLPSLLSRIELEQSQFDKDIKQVESKVDRLAKNIEQTFKRMEQIGKRSAMGLAALAAALGGALWQSSKLETAMMRLQVATSGTAGAYETLEKNAKALTRASAENISSIRAVSAELWMATSNIGLTAEQTADLVNLSEAISTIWGTDFPAVTQRMTIALMGSTRALRDYGLEMSDTSIQQWMLDRGIKGTISTMTEAQAATIRYQFIMENMGAALSGGAIAGATFANEFDRMKNSFLDFIARVGKPFIEQAKQIVIQIRTFFELAADSEPFIELTTNVIKITGIILGLGVAIGVLGKVGSMTFTLLGFAVTFLTSPLLMTIALVGLLISQWEKISGIIDFNLGESWAKFKESISEETAAIREDLEKGDYLGAFVGTIDLMVKVVWRGFQFMGARVMDLGGWLKANLAAWVFGTQPLYAAGEVYRDVAERTFVDIGWLELIVAVGAKIWEITWPRIQWLVKKPIQGLADWVREKLGIEEDRIEVPLGENLKVILTGALVGAEWLIDWIVKGLDWAVQELGKLGDVMSAAAEGIELEPADQTLYDRFMGFGRMLGELIVKGFEVSLKLYDIVSTAISEIVEEMTGSEALGKIAGHAIPLFFIAQWTGLGRFVSEWMKVLALAGLIARPGMIWVLPIVVVLSLVVPHQKIREETERALNAIEMARARIGMITAREALVKIGIETPSFLAEERLEEEWRKMAVWEQALAMSIAYGEKAAKGFLDAWSTFPDDMAEIGTELGKAFKGAWDTTVDIVGWIGGQFEQGWSKFKTWGKETAQKIWDGMKEIFTFGWLWDMLFGRKTEEEPQELEFKIGDETISTWGLFGERLAEVNLEMEQLIRNIQRMPDMEYKEGGPVGFTPGVGGGSIGLALTMIDAITRVGTQQTGGYTADIGESTVAGVVHGGEWVAPAWMVKEYQGLFAGLENVRKGYQVGGFVDAYAGTEAMLDFIEPIFNLVRDTLGVFTQIMLDISKAILGTMAAILEAMGVDSAVITKIREAMEKFEDLTQDLWETGEKTFEDLRTAIRDTRKEMEFGVPRGIDPGREIEMIGRPLVFGMRRIGRDVADALESSQILTALIDIANSNERLKVIWDQIISAAQIRKVDPTTGIVSWELPDIEEIGKLFDEVKDIGMDMMKSGKALLSGIADIALALGPEATLIIAGIAVASAAIIGFGYALMKLSDAVNQFKRGFRQATSGVMDILKRPFYEVGHLIGREFLPLLRAFTPTIRAVAEIVYNIMMAFLRFLRPLELLITNIGHFMRVIQTLVEIFFFWRGLIRMIIGQFSLLATASEWLGIAAGWVADMMVGAAEWLYTGIQWVVNGIVEGINGFLEWINDLTKGLLDLQPIEWRMPDFGEIPGRPGTEPPEGDGIPDTTVGWNQPIVNNWNVTFTGNYVLDTDDDALRRMWDKLIKYAREHDMEIVVG